MTDWKIFFSLKQEMNWGDSRLMEPLFLEELDWFLHIEHLEFFISQGNQGHHVEGSEHYRGLACDIVFPKILQKNLPDVFHTALRYDFTGVGIYSEWNYHDKKVGGLHLQKVPEQIHNRKRLWLWGPNGEEALSYSRMKELF